MTTTPKQEEGAARERMFPVFLGANSQRRWPGCPTRIPWRLLAPHDAQAQANHGGQNLECLAQRGGLSPDEILAVMNNRNWSCTPKDMNDALFLLKVMAATPPEGMKL